MSMRKHDEWVWVTRVISPLISFSPLIKCLYTCSRSLSVCRISTESHSPKLQIRSHSYLRAVSEVSINRSLDSLDPAGLLASPKFRSRNESYMRAMSTISQVGHRPPSSVVEIAIKILILNQLERTSGPGLDPKGDFQPEPLSMWPLLGLQRGGKPRKGKK